MTIGSWEPTTKVTQDPIDISVLKHIILFMENNTDDVGACFNQQEQVQHLHLMKTSLSDWQKIEANLSNEDIILLIRFFTLAEMQFNSWEGGEHSPVIFLAKIYRKRNKNLDKDLLAWIKKTSDNKFLPYGPL